MSQFKQKPKILVVDDRLQNLYAMEKLLNELDVEIVQTTSGSEALALTLEHDFCLAIVDVQMPEMDGYELVELLRGNESTQTLPVIFVSAIYSDEYHHRKGYEAGAVDFLSKPFVPEILLGKIRVFLDLYRQRVELQDLRCIEAQRARDLAKLSADKDEFFASVSREMGAPFNTLLDDSHLMFIAGQQLTKEQIQEMAERVYSSAGTIHNLVETLMTWSGMQRMHMEYQPDEINLRNLVNNLVEVWQKTAVRKNIELSSAIEEEIYVCGDEVMLGAVIRNLIANALKFTLSGGWVKLSARVRVEDKNGRVKAEGKVQPQSSLLSPRSFVEVSVVDSGVGIGREGMAKLFRIDIPYTTTGTAKEKGTGLGLIMCKKMVEYHGGRIEVESVGRGTTVRFTVPAADLSGCTG